MKIAVIDGNSIVNRAFYGVRPLTNSSGMQTQAVYGFLTILGRLIDEELPDAVCAAFDLRAPTFRHERYEAYKAGRKPMPEELAAQMPYVADILDAMGIPLLSLEGYEADDILGTAAREAEESGWDCVLMTGDRDSFQLIGERTSVRFISTRMGRSETVIYDANRFREEYGFGAELFVDLKALMGDSSDNIPGVPGIGGKTALGLVRGFGGVDAIYENIGLEGISGNVRKKLQNGRDMAYLSRELAEINRHVPIDAAPGKMIRRAWDTDRLYKIFMELGFKSLIERYGLKPQDRALSKEAAVFSRVGSEREAGELLARLRNTEACAFAVTPAMDAVAVRDGADAALIAACDFSGDGYEAFLRGFFAPDIKKTGHGIKNVMRGLLELSIPFGGFEFDTELAAYLINPSEGGYSAERLSTVYLGRELPPERDYAAENAFSPLSDREIAGEALCAHASAYFDMVPVLSSKIKELSIERLYRDIEHPLCEVLAKMEHAGVGIDRNALSLFREELSARLAELEREIYSLAGGAFNVNSTKQLGEILFERLGLPAAKKTKTGYSTDAEVLEGLHGSHPIIDSLLQYRVLSKLKSTYADGLLKVVAPDGRIHTSFHMTATATGRLSSTEPNLQNIPVRQEFGSRLRGMFVPKEGFVLIDADYSQIELRILAHISDDATMLGAFRNGEDIHRITASQVLGIPPEDVTPEMRGSAKAVNFGIVYGISDFSLARDIGVTRAEAKAYIDGYLERYSGVREYMRSVVEYAKRDGFVRTLYGRIRYLPELKASKYQTRQFGERAAMNTPIQGTAADIMKLAMVNADRRLSEFGGARLVLQIHDELIVEAPEEDAAAVAEILAREMEHAACLKVPLVADASWGKSWLGAKK